MARRRRSVGPAVVVIVPLPRRRDAVRRIARLTDRVSGEDDVPAAADQQSRRAPGSPGQADPVATPVTASSVPWITSVGAPDGARTSRVAVVESTVGVAVRIERLGVGLVRPPDAVLDLLRRVRLA